MLADGCSTFRATEAKCKITKMGGPNDAEVSALAAGVISCLVSVKLEHLPACPKACFGLE